MNLDLSLGLEALDKFLQHLLATLGQSLFRELLFVLIEPVHIGPLAIFEGKDIGVILLRVNLIRERSFCRQFYPSRPQFRKLSDFRKLSRATEKPAGPKGRRHRAAAVTERAASTFEQLTGYRATVSVDPHSHRSYGTFLEFLADVFRVLGIRASPEAQARAFLKEKRHRKNGA